MSASHQSVPPPPPSHTGDPRSNGEQPKPYVIRVTRLSLLGVVMLLFGVVFPIGGAPATLSWLLALPVLAAAWVLRTQTTVTATGLRARTLFGSRTVEWTEVRGVRVPDHGFARAVLRDDSEVKLPAVDFTRLPELIAHSGGRLPDPYAAPAAERIGDEPAVDQTPQPQDTTPPEDAHPRDLGPNADADGDGA